MNYLPLFCITVFCFVPVYGQDSLRDLEPIKPVYVPDVFNQKRVRPIMAGDFVEFFELWLGKPYMTEEGAMLSDLFIMKSRYGHRTYEGVRVGTVPHFGADLRFLPVPSKEYLVMSNGKRLELYTLWGKRQIQIRPNWNYKNQFIVGDWLFLNRTHCVHLDGVIGSPNDLTEEKLLQTVANIPTDIIDKATRDYAVQNCFSYGVHCALDPDDSFHRLRLFNSEVVAYRYGLKVSTLEVEEKGNSIPRHFIYILEDDISGEAYYIPPELETFKKPPNFPYDRRFMIIPILNPHDRFITTRRHQIFVANNRMHPLQPTARSLPCNCVPPISVGRTVEPLNSSTPIPFSPFLFLCLLLAVSTIFS